MTEHHHDSHGHGGGGHELDAPPTRELFNIVWGLSALTLLSLVTCVQLFNNQARDLNEERGKEGSYVLAKYRQDMEKRTRGSGEDTVLDVTGKVVARYDYIPLASARDLILAKPEKLGAFPPPPGWIHPDDLAAGGQPTQTPPPPPMPAMPTPTDGAAAPPAEGTPPALQPGPKDEAQPVNLDKGQSESTKPAAGGTVEPVGAKSPPVEPKPPAESKVPDSPAK